MKFKGLNNKGYFEIEISLWLVLFSLITVGFFRMYAHIQNQHELLEKEYDSKLRFLTKS